MAIFLSDYHYPNDSQKNGGVGAKGGLGRGGGGRHHQRDFLPTTIAAHTGMLAGGVRFNMKWKKERKKEGKK